MTLMPQYDILRMIGNGCFGYVFEAYDRNLKRKVALKRIEKVGKHISREYEILSMIRECPNVIKMEVPVVLPRISSTLRPKEIG